MIKCLIRLVVAVIGDGDATIIKLILREFVVVRPGCGGYDDQVHRVQHIPA
jgi:hypothetical protein